jgi:hypothetical protein
MINEPSENIDLEAETYRLLKAYEQNPIDFSKSCFMKHCTKSPIAADLTTLGILISDDFLRIRPGEEGGKVRFLTILSKLPLELQMTLSNYSVGINESLIPHKILNEAITKQLHLLREGS